MTHCKMLLLRLILLVHGIAATEITWDFDDYIAVTNESVLMRIEHRRVTETYDLSNLGLVGIDKNAFTYDSGRHVKTLHLENNWLKNIPESAFWNLPNLIYFTLADNNITCCLENVFIGLNKLEVLNMTNNDLTQIGSNYFAGVPDSTIIMIDGNPLSNMSTALFGESIAESKPLSIENEVENQITDLKENDDVRVKVCFKPLSDPNRWVKFVDIWNTSTLPKDCQEAKVNWTERRLSLHNLGIAYFDDNWYGLGDLPISSIDLSNNSLRASYNTSKLLKSLPANIDEVNLSNNRLGSPLASDRNFILIDNPNLRSLNLAGNGINKIEPDSFENTALVSLNLSQGVISNLTFVKNLPLSLVELDLSRNRIAYYSGSISNLHQLVYLNLSYNSLGSPSNQLLRGLSSLQNLDLSYSHVTNLPMGIFQDLKNLKNLNLANNKIEKLDKRSFVGLKSIEVLNLDQNELSEITNNTFYAIPDTLLTLTLNGNSIKYLEDHSFVRVPKHTLSLDQNSIIKITNRCFNLPYLEELSLNNNGLSELHTWGNLKGLKRLFLASNIISKIWNGSMIKMDKLDILDLSRNRITSLERGALFGLPKSSTTFVRLSGTPIKLIEGPNVFDRF